MSRAREIAFALDRLLNAVCGGYSTDFLSSRCWRLRAYQPYKTLRPLIDHIFFWHVEHCRGSFENEKRRANTPPEYLQQDTPK